MTREEFGELRVTFFALEKINVMLKHEYTKRVDKIKKEEIKPFKIIYQGIEYCNENEIIDAYGCGMITASARDSLCKRMRKHFSFENLKDIGREADILKELIYMLEDKMSEISDELAKGCDDQ